AVAAVAEGGVVVVVADAGVQADALDDLGGVQAAGDGVGVELVEVGHAHGQVGVGEQLDGLGLGGAGEQDGHVLVLGSFQEQVGDQAPGAAGVAHDDARGVQVVVDRKSTRLNSS